MAEPTLVNPMVSQVMVTSNLKRMQLDAVGASKQWGAQGTPL